MRHNKRVSAFVIPDRCLQARGLDLTVERVFLQRGAVDTRSKTQLDMMIAEMTTAEQNQYLHHDDKSGSRLTALTSVMLEKNSRSIQIVKGGCCLDTAWQDESRSCNKKRTT